MKYLLSFLVLILLIVSFVGCSDSEETNIHYLTYYPSFTSISIPLDIDSLFIPDILYDGYGQFFEYNAERAEFIPRVFVKPGVSYLIGMSEDDTVTIVLKGEKLDSLSFHIFEGDNIFPMIYDPVPLSKFDHIECFVSQMYYKVSDSFYVVEDELECFKSYYVESDAEGILTIMPDTVIFEEIQ